MSIPNKKVSYHKQIARRPSWSTDRLVWSPCKIWLFLILCAVCAHVWGPKNWGGTLGPHPLGRGRGWSFEYASPSPVLTVPNLVILGQTVLYERNYGHLPENFDPHGSITLQGYSRSLDWHWSINRLRPPTTSCSGVV